MVPQAPPSVGDLFQHHQHVGPCTFTEDQSQALLVLTPTPGSEAEDKIRLLAVLGHEDFEARG